MSISRRNLLLGAGSLGVLGVVPTASAQANASPALEQMRERRADWLVKAEALIPPLSKTVQAPVNLVRAIPDAAAPLRFRMENEAPAEQLEQRVLAKGAQFILDFEGHRAGHLQFDLVGVGNVDAPVRLRLTFGEVPPDVAEPLYPYKGTLATGWLPDEIINVDYLPQTVTLPRRYAFRYVKVEVIDTSITFRVRFRNVRALALTSATTTPASLGSGDALLDRIDRIGIATLRDCMQTVFEDGPRRDQRLWVGDLRLQALTAYCTYGGADLVKRCLYLFAAFPRASDGLVGACVYEKPKPAYGGIHIFDYAALFNVALYDYVQATRDVQTGLDLWPVALRQLELLGREVNADGLFVNRKRFWLFIDWAEQLDRTTPIQGVLIHAFERTLELARLIGRDGDVAGLDVRVAKMRSAARSAWFDPQRGVFVSGPARQVSWASQAWMAIAGVAQSGAEAGTALKRAMTMPDAVKPVTPYLYHYVVEGLIAAGERGEALKLLKHYWGGMALAGANTFWEVYDPDNPLVTPYGDVHINSFCHAWSCTPSYLLRVRGLARGVGA